jgi:hypothetical protein
LVVQVAGVSEEKVRLTRKAAEAKFETLTNGGEQ